jgi:uncharacterized repeat protein (TIGR01451 family)
VNYQVGGVAQTLIESSLAGNSNPGLNQGSNTDFVVDNRVDHTVTEVGGAATTVGAGALNVVTTFKLTNTGNNPQGYKLDPSNVGGTLFTHPDTFDMTPATLRRFVSTAACSGVSPTPTYASATDTATAVNTLAADACVYVFIVADTPVSATNGGAANVRLTATTADAGTNGVTLTTENPGTADTALSMDVVFIDAGVNVNRVVFADDQYYVQTAALTVAKTSTVVSDPINGTAGPGVFPKAIPLAVVEYGITLTNTGAVAASVVTITDLVPANTTFATGTYNAGASNVSIQTGAITTFCVAEAGGTDSNADGCVRTAGGVLSVGSPALATVATGAGNAVTVRFRVTIN